MAEPTEGYIRVHRRLWEHPYWQDPDRLRAWIDCLLMAAWKPHRRLVATSQVDIPRGAFVASERFLAERWGWSRGKVRRFLAAAQEADEIRPIHETSGGTTYLVVKYDDYQRGRPGDDTSNGTEGGPPSDQERTTIGPPSDQIEGRERTEEEGKEVGGGAEPQPPLDWTNELHAIRDELADRYCTTDRERRSFTAATDMLIGDPLAHWKNPHTGEPIPTGDRPALYRAAALSHFEKPENNLASSLLYVRKRSLDPGNDPEAKKQAAVAADRRLEEQKKRDAEITADQVAMKRWEREHPEEAQRIREEVEAFVEEQGIGRGMLVKAETSRRIRAAMEGVKRAG